MGKLSKLAKIKENMARFEEHMSKGFDNNQTYGFKETPYTTEEILPRSWDTDMVSKNPSAFLFDPRMDYRMAAQQDLGYPQKAYVRQQQIYPDGSVRRRVIEEGIERGNELSGNGDRKNVAGLRMKLEGKRQYRPAPEFKDIFGDNLLDGADLNVARHRRMKDVNDPYSQVQGEAYIPQTRFMVDTKQKLHLDRIKPYHQKIQELDEELQRLHDLRTRYTNEASEASKDIIDKLGIYKP